MTIKDVNINNDQEENAEGAEELYERFSLVVDKGQEPMRLDKFLVARIEGASHNKVQQSIESGRVTVNGKTDIWPSWYKKSNDANGVKMTFDKVSKKKATDCTPAGAKIEQIVQTITDPITNKKSYIAPDGYDPNADDDTHKCDDVKPFVSVTSQSLGGGKYRITATMNKGTFALQSLRVTVDGQTVIDQAVSDAGSASADFVASSNGDKSVQATLIDTGYYEASETKTMSVKTSSTPSSFASVDSKLFAWGRRSATTTGS